MRMLCLHVDYIKWKPTKEIKPIAEEASLDWATVNDCVACLTAVESKDENNPLLIEQAVKGINEVTGQVKVKRVVLYPYAHLSNSLSKPVFAKQTLEGIKTELEKQGFFVTKAPFGWYKEFELKCKGHPLAEAGRII